MVTVACPICGSVRARSLCLSRDYVYGIGGDFRFVRCRECSHVFMNPRPSAASLLACYPAGYGPYEGGGVSEAASPGFPEPSVVSGAATRRIRRWVGTKTGLRAFLRWLGDERATVLPRAPRPGVSRMLEIGCAHGGYLQRAAAAGWLVDGIEPSPEAAAQAESRGIPVFVGRLDQAKLQPSSREAIAFWMVLEHVPEPVEFLSTVQRTLTPGGVVALSIPNAHSLERWVFGRYWQGYDPPRHLQVFTATEIRRVLLQLGFVDVRVIYQPGIRDTYAGLAAWGIENFPRARWPRRLMEIFRGETPRWLHWLSLIPAQVLARAGLAGRITVAATKPLNSVPQFNPPLDR